MTRSMHPDGFDVARAADRWSASGRFRFANYGIRSAIHRPLTSEDSCWNHWRGRWLPAWKWRGTMYSMIHYNNKNNKFRPHPARLEGTKGNTLYTGSVPSYHSHCRVAVRLARCPISSKNQVLHTHCIGASISLPNHKAQQCFQNTTTGS